MKQRRGIRRIIVWAGIFLLLVSGGAIVNIAVAWLLVWARFARTSDISWASANDKSYWREFAPSELRHFTVNDPIRLAEGLGFAERTWSAVDPEAIGKRPTTRVARRSNIIAGWPKKCLQGELWSVIDDTGVPQRPMEQGSISFPVGHDALLPLIPMWPGFAINTLFYAAILWLLFAAPFALRRWRRLKRGLCPACAYPVGTSTLCTECGKPIPESLTWRVRWAGSDSAPNDAPGSTHP